MIRAILFVLGFLALAVLIGLAIWQGIVFAKSKEERDDDGKQLERELRQIRDKYQDKVWRLNSSSPKFLEEKANLEAQMKAEQEEAVKNWEKPKIKGRVPLIICAVLALSSLGFVIVVPGSFHQIEAGSVAVVKELGKITEVRTPGTYFDFYMTRHYEIYDATVQQVEIKTAAYSHDAQTMDLELYLQYQIQLDKLIIRDANGSIVQSEGIAGKYVTLDSLQARIQTQTVEKTKAVMSAEHFYDKDPDTGLYPANDFAMTGENIIRHRADVSNKVSEVVRAAIGDDYYVNVQDVVLTNIDFTDEFERAVENKVIEEQNKIAAITRAEAELETARIAAEKKIVEAQADAQQQIILAEAAAKAATAKVIELARATGFPIETAYVYSNSETGLSEVHNTPIAETETIKFVETRYTISYDATHTKDDLDKLVISYLEYLAYLEKWDGKLPEVVAGDDAISIIVPNN